MSSEFEKIIWNYPCTWVKLEIEAKLARHSSKSTCEIVLSSKCMYARNTVDFLEREHLSQEVGVDATIVPCELPGR